MKKMTYLIVLILIGSLFAGCSSASDENVLKIGVDDSYPPMEFINDDNELVGFDVDFAKALGEEMDMEVEFISTAWDGIFAGLEAEKYDVIISSVSITEDRLKSYDVSSPYLANGQVIVVPAGADSVDAIEELEGMTVGVQVETTSHNSAQKVQESVDFELNPYDQIIQTFMDLKTGRLDAIVVDSMVAGEYMSNEPDTYQISSAKLSNEPVAVYFKQGSNDELLEKVNGAIKNLQSDGTMTEISMKWFNADFTSDIDSNLW